MERIASMQIGSAWTGRRREREIVRMVVEMCIVGWGWLLVGERVMWMVLVLDGYVFIVIFFV